jgi:hypothetical protein
VNYNFPRYIYRVNKGELYIHINGKIPWPAQQPAQDGTRADVAFWRTASSACGQAAVRNEFNEFLELAAVELAAELRICPRKLSHLLR